MTRVGGGSFEDGVRGKIGWRRAMVSALISKGLGWGCSEVYMRKKS